jgi:hypothetical protein
MSDRLIPNMHIPTVPELLKWWGKNDFAWYLPPMDVHPSRIYIRSKVKTWANPNRFAVSVEKPGTLKFRIDEAHLNRIYLPNN